MTDNCESCDRGSNAFCPCGQECCRPLGLPEIIGLDLSLTCTGVAGYGFVDTIKSKGSKDATLIDRCVRIGEIVDRINRVTQPYDRALDIVVIEGPSYASKDPGIWDRAGLWWSVVQPLLLNGTPVAVVPPSVLKKYATGKGNASKDEVLLAASRRYPSANITENNGADAMVLYAMGCDWLGHQLETVPQVNRNALASVAWPEVIA